VRLREETHLPIVLVDDPLITVVNGTGKVLDDLELLRKVSIASEWSR
ncbi:MAG: rod shape-determining protein, partial [Nitrospirae bacterium]|nr:rod shape-determining protein [Candidatus Troglogloeales bacterium]